MKLQEMETNWFATKDIALETTGVANKNFNADEQTQLVAPSIRCQYGTQLF